MQPTWKLRGFRLWCGTAVAWIGQRPNQLSTVPITPLCCLEVHRESGLVMAGANAWTAAEAACSRRNERDLSAHLSVT